MQILVTGAAGYIGSVICEQLGLNGHEMIVVDDLRDGKKAALPANAVFYEGNFGAETLLETIFSTHAIELVIHLAASASVPDSVINPITYYENNVSGTVTLLKKMREHRVNSIIFSSTAAVYGEPQFVPITEEHPCRPVNPYGFSKLFDEQVIRDCAQAYGIRYFIFRYFCAAGATALHGESRGHESHLLPLAIDTAMGKRTSLQVFGNDFETQDGTGVRDFIHVADIANAHLLAMQAPVGKWNQALNLGSGTGYSVLEIIRETEKITGNMIAFQVADKRPGDPASLIASFDKAEEVIGWKPGYDLATIIRTALEWRKKPLY